MKSNWFPPDAERRDDGRRANIPEVIPLGAATSGNMKKKALKNIQAVFQLIAEGLLESGEPQPVHVPVADRRGTAVTLV